MRPGHGGADGWGEITEYSIFCIENRLLVFIRMQMYRDGLAYKVRIEDGPNAACNQRAFR